MPIRGYSLASPTRTSRSWEVWHSEDQAEAKPQDLSSSGVPTSGRSGRGHEEAVGGVY